MVTPGTTNFMGAEVLPGYVRGRARLSCFHPFYLKGVRSSGSSLGDNRSRPCSDGLGPGNGGEDRLGVDLPGAVGVRSGISAMAATVRERPPPARDVWKWHVEIALEDVTTGAAVIKGGGPTCSLADRGQGFPLKFTEGGRFADGDCRWQSAGTQGVLPKFTW